MVRTMIYDQIIAYFISDDFGFEGSDGLFQLFETLDICKSDASQTQEKAELFSRVNMPLRS